MSAFKRHQSKVFWNQMESLDNKIAPTSFKIPANRSTTSQQARKPRPLPFPASRESEEAFTLTNDEDNPRDDDDSDDNTTDTENTTVIRVDLNASSDASSARSINQKPSTNESPSSSSALSNQIANNVKRFTLSPSSTRCGQRSQDSGFSDSDDENEEEDNNVLSSRWRLRRRHKKKRVIVNRGKLQSLRMNGDNDWGQSNVNYDDDDDNDGVGPAHTSTPKVELNRCRAGGRSEAMTAKQLEFDDGNSKLTSDRQKNQPPHETSFETLDDFLYPIDQPPPSSLRTINDHDNVTSAKIWLIRLRNDTEDECMSTLQSKSLPRRKNNTNSDNNAVDGGETGSRDLRFLTVSATTAAKKIIDTAGRFDVKYKRIVDDLGDNARIDSLDKSALTSLENEAAEIIVKYGRTLPRRIIIDRRSNETSDIVMQLTRLKHSVDRALDERLDFYIEKVVRGLEDAPSENGGTARGALAALTALGLAGPRAGASVARCHGIRALITNLVASYRRVTELRSATLRALASVCCCIEAIDQFVNDDGPEILADLLGRRRRRRRRRDDDDVDVIAIVTPDSERTEAAALLVQITSPWMERVALPHVEPYGRDFVKSLTDIAEGARCKQTLLIAAAGLNNLAHSRLCVGAIIECDSIKKLLRCIKKSNDGNVWLMEQVAALVGQVARLPQARAHLVETRASVALVCFLRMQPPGHEDEYRRLVATTKDTLARLCVVPEIAKQVVAIGGGFDFLPSNTTTIATNKRDRDEGARFHSTKSLRVARRIAAEQIGLARIHDRSPH